MEQATLEGIKLDILADVFDHNRGGKFARFKRALWYGSTGRIGGYLGDGKGLRKAIRNVPEKQFKKNTTHLVGQPVKFALAPISAVPVVGPLVSSLITGIIVTPVKLAIDELVSQIKSTYRMKVDDGTSIKGDIKAGMRKLFNKDPRTADEEIRKQIKLDIKLLKGEDYLLTIDRNLVKMKDAQHRIVPSIKKLEALVEPTRNTFETLDDNFYKNNEKRMEAANQVLVDIVETGYYIGKITLLVDTMQKALTKVKGELAELDKAINTVDEKVEDYILKNL